VGRYPKEFRRMAVERLKTCDNIVELSQELGVHRLLLYKWRDQFDPFDSGEESPPGNSRETTLRTEINQLKRVLVDKTLELFSSTPVGRNSIAKSRSTAGSHRGADETQLDM
jgi:transposase-like protein